MEEWRKLLREVISLRKWGECFFCGRGHCLSDHHIIFQSYGGNEIEEENKVPLCTDCHKRYHKKVGKNNNSKAYLIIKLLEMREDSLKN